MLLTPWCIFVANFCLRGVTHSSKNFCSQPVPLDVIPSWSPALINVIIVLCTLRPPFFGTLCPLHIPFPLFPLLLPFPLFPVLPLLLLLSSSSPGGTTTGSVSTFFPLSSMQNWVSWNLEKF